MLPPASIGPLPGSTVRGASHSTPITPKLLYSITPSRDPEPEGIAPSIPNFLGSGREP